MVTVNTSCSASFRDIVSLYIIQKKAQFSLITEKNNYESNVVLSSSLHLIKIFTYVFMSYGLCRYNKKKKKNFKNEEFFNIEGKRCII